MAYVLTHTIVLQTTDASDKNLLTVLLNVVRYLEIVSLTKFPVTYLGSLETACVFFQPNPPVNTQFGLEQSKTRIFLFSAFYSLKKVMRRHHTSCSSVTSVTV